MNTTINIGDRFGHLTIINKDTRPLHRASWLCRCDCGRELYVITSDLLRGIKSCGCSHFSDKYAPIDLTGKRFGHLTAIVRQNPATHKAIWLCLCDCGNTLTIRTSHLITGRTKSCGCLTGKPSYTIDLTGKRFGLLTVISRHPSTKSPHTWVCHCDCGNTVNISTSNLLSGHNKSCGCITRKIKEAYSQDLTGRRFNHLTVLSRSLNPQHKSRWLCLCDCGNTCEFITSDLLKGKVSSCGCRKHTLDDSFVDLTGKRFGHLNVISYSIDFNNRVIWHCFCDCGNDVFLSANRLLKNGQTHCGPNCKYLPLQKKERMLGKRYNHLTVKRILEIEPKQYKLLCLCDCGDYTLATPYQLTSGSKRSCGCDLKKYKLSP